MPMEQRGTEALVIRERIGIECHFGHCMQIYVRRAVTTENSMTNIF